jgi:GxxExxY protein
VGEYVGDLLVERQIIVELKVCKNLDEVHEAICLNYLRATRKRVLLLMNFAKPRLEFRRLVLD